MVTHFHPRARSPHPKSRCNALSRTKKCVTPLPSTGAPLSLMAASIWLITYQRTIEIHAYVGRPRLTKRFCIAISNSFLGTTLLPPVSKITRIPAADFDEGRGAKNAEPYSRRTEGPSSERGREYILEIHHNTREHRAGNQQKSSKSTVSACSHVFPYLSLQYKRQSIHFPLSQRAQVSVPRIMELSLGTSRTSVIAIIHSYRMLP
jgi:hypothetical protein